MNIVDNLRATYDHAGRTYTRKLNHREIYAALGITSHKLPDAGHAGAMVGNVFVWVLPKIAGVAQDAARTCCTCPVCARKLTAGKLQQHIKVHNRPAPAPEPEPFRVTHSGAFNPEPAPVAESGDRPARLLASIAVAVAVAVSAVALFPARSPVAVAAAPEPVAISEPVAVAPEPVALLPVALPAPRPAGSLRDAVRAFYAIKSPSTRAALAFDTCALPEGSGADTARTHWLGPKRRAVYDRAAARLTAAYRASPGTDGAVMAIERDYCRAVMARFTKRRG